MSVIGNRLIMANRARLSITAATRLFSKKSIVQAFTPTVSLKLLKPPTVFSTDLVIKKNYSSANEDLKKRFDGLVKDKGIVVFMKGTPEQPLCGFSRAVCQILMAHGAKFDAYNCLEDESLRQGIKEYTEWPTIPQVFFKGEFIGGCDILLEMHRSGDIIDELAAIGIKSKLAEPEEKK